MSLPLFIRGLVGVLLVFAVTTYLITGSLWTTFIQTVICSILVQVGYFVAVLFLVWRSAGAEKKGAITAKGETGQSLSKEEQPTGEVGRLPGAPTSHHP